MDEQEKKKQVLIVENDKALSVALAETIVGVGYGTRIALSGEEALEMIKKEKPDLILLDILLGQVTGIDVLKKVRESDEWGKNVPIVILTSVTFLQNMEETKRLATEFIFKGDYETQELIDVIKKLLQ